MSSESVPYVFTLSQGLSRIVDPTHPNPITYLLLPNSLTNAILGSGSVRTCDMMGNACIAGGAQLKVTTAPAVKVDVVDAEDGTYELEWQAPLGLTEMVIQIAGVHITGSPFRIHGVHA